MVKEFSLASMPQLHFGAGMISVLPTAAKNFGGRVLLITGAHSFISSEHGQNLLEEFRASNILVEQFSIAKEPSPDMIDAAVKEFSDEQPDCVIAVGGGSALDGGKAISAMLPLGRPVKDYLEGVGKVPAHPGVKVPFIAVPTTSGTGSEATKNAVISEIGEAGYKRSLRHNNFVPDLAIVDPVLTLSCPSATTAASGMDAFTQLLESYVSTASNPMTDALAVEGLKCVAGALANVYRDGANLEARTDMALASYLSGITLANAGLGLVHGFASPIGGYFEIPHGVICSTLMGPVNRITVRKLRVRKNHPEALKKYATVGKIFSQEGRRPDDYYIDSLLSTIESWSKEMNIPSLSRYGIKRDHFNKIVEGTGNKNNPIALEHDEMVEVLEAAFTHPES